MRFVKFSMAMLALLFVAWPASAAQMAARSLERLKSTPPVCADSFDFVVCGDSRSAELVELPKVFYTMISEWNDLKPAFVVNTGDLIMGGPVPELDAMWSEFEKAVAGCNVPFFPVAGNHDVSPDPVVIKIYEERIAPLVYGFSYGNSLFIILNSQEGGASRSPSAVQLEQLKGFLGNSAAKHVFLFLHDPFFKLNWDRDWISTAEAIKGFPVRAVFAGHEHMYRDCGVRDGVRYVITGGGGSEPSAPEEEGGFFHYLLVRVRGNDVSWSVIRPGAVFPEDVITEVNVQAARQLQNHLKCQAIELPWGEKFDRTVAISLDNPFNEPVKSNLKWNAPQGWHVDPVQSDYAVEPGASASLQFRVWADTIETTRFPVPVVATSVQPPDMKGPVELRSALAYVPTTTAVRATEPVKADGNLSEWSRAASIPLTYPVGYDIADKRDLSASVRLMWDDNHVYVAIEANDNEFHQPFSGDIVWSADSVEFWLEESVWSFSLTGQGPQVFIDYAPGRHLETVIKTVDLGVKRDGTRITYEAAFPKQEVSQVRLKPGSSFRFSILVNDLDPSGPIKPRHYVELTPGAGSHFKCPMVKAILTE
jgi:hypothetical protein